MNATSKKPAWADWRRFAANAATEVEVKRFWCGSDEEVEGARGCAAAPVVESSAPPSGAVLLPSRARSDASPLLLLLLPAGVAAPSNTVEWEVAEAATEETDVNITAAACAAEEGEG